jgi:integrase
MPMNKVSFNGVATKAAIICASPKTWRPRLRRTCAKLCRKSGGDFEQIKFLLGHSSIQTTERYLGSEQEIVVAVNDNLGL